MTFPVEITSPPQDGAPIVLNRNLAVLAHQSVYAQNESGSSGLVWAYYGSTASDGKSVRWGGFTVSAGTLTLTASSTNYIVVLRSTGAISVSTASTNWDDTTAYARVYKVTAGATAVSSVEDHRAGAGGLGGGAGGGGAAAAEDVTITDTGGYYASADVEGALQEVPAIAAAAVAAVVDMAPGALDTLNELAAALGDDANFAATTAAALALKAPLASPALTGTPTAPTAAPGTNTTQVATTAFVEAAVASAGGGDALTSGTLAQFAATTSAQLRGVLTDETGTGSAVFADSPALTGTPTAPTAAPGTNTTQAATTAFVAAAVAAGGGGGSSIGLVLALQSGLSRP
ncbi:MAG: hypothetical protein V4792_16605 [Pseudomonadota bacterium]